MQNVDEIKKPAIYIHGCIIVRIVGITSKKTVFYYVYF